MHIDHRSLKIPARNSDIFLEDGYPPQNILTHVGTKSIFHTKFSVINIFLYHFHFKVRQAHSEGCYSNYNETTYSEPFEMPNNYSSLQSCYPYGDNDYDLDTYSYNHLHEKTLYMITDAYVVVEPMFGPLSLQTNAEIDSHNHN